MEPLQNVATKEGRTVRAMDISRDNVLALAYSDGALDHLRLPFGAPTQMGRLQDTFERIKWSPSALPRRLACAMSDGLVVVWTESAATHAFTPALFRADGGRGFEVRDVAWSPDAARFASVSMDARLRVWDPSNEAHPLVATKVLDGWGQALAWDPVARYLALVVNSDVVVLRAADLSPLIRRSDAKAAWVAWSPDGQYLCTALQSGTCLVSGRGALEASPLQLTGHAGAIAGLCFAPVVYPHHVLAVAGSDGVLTLWSTDDNKAFRTEKLASRPLDVRFSSDGVAVYVLLASGVVSCDAKPPTGAALRDEDFERLMKQRYGDAEASIAPSPAVLQQERAPVAKPMPPPPPPPASSSSSPARPAVKKQSESVNADGKRRITPINVNNPTAATTTTTTTATAAPQKDCGTCKYCLDKPKFGGPNVLRRPCEKRPQEKRLRTEASTNGDKKPAAAGAARADEDEELVLSDWDLSDLEPEWRAEEASHPLLALEPYSFLAEDQRGEGVKTLSVDAAHALKFAPATTREKPFRTTRVSLVDAVTGAVQWTYPLCGQPVACKREAGVLVLATDASEVYALDFASSALVGPVVRLSKPVACLCAGGSSAKPVWAALSRDARLWMPGVAAGLVVDPLVSAHEENGLEPIDCERKLLLSPGGTPVVLVCTPRTLKAFALVRDAGWCVVVDPLRFVGSEFVDLSPVRAAASGGVDGFLRHVTMQLLIEGLDESRLGAHAALLPATSLPVTVAHLDFMVRAARVLRSADECAMWLGVLCDRLVADASNKALALRLSAELAREDSALLHSVVLPRLAKARQFASVVEEMTDLSSFS